jgi:hypothetical protein
MDPADIDSIPKPPYEGQGEPLPVELSLNGDWIIQDSLLLVRLSPRGKHGLVFGVHLGHGRHCEGIDADLLADQIDAIPDGGTLMEMNRDHCLAVSSQKADPVPGAERAIFYTFVTPRGGCFFRANVARIQGNA